MDPTGVSSVGGPDSNRSRGCSDVRVASDEALYVFCLARAGPVSDIDGPGMDVERPDRPLQLLCVRDVAAIVSRVSLDAFCGPDADQRMSTLGWIAPRACRHEEVIEHVMRRSPVVPARFSTLFSSAARLAEWVDGRYPDVCRALDRFANHEEWSVKGAWLVARAERQLVAEGMARVSPALSSGARYLQEQRIRSRIGEALEARILDARASTARELLQHAADHRERPLGPQMQEENGAPFANWAFLVPRAEVAAFLACVKKLNDAFASHGVILEASGPWPPYSFSSALDHCDRV